MPTNFKRNQFINKILFIALIGCIPFYTWAQAIRVNVIVTPPYSSAISDYINQPGKTIVTLTSGLDYPEMDIYLTASLTSDNGIKIRTNPNDKPVSPIKMQPGSVYTLSGMEISDMYGINNMLSEGIEINELFDGAGLPEGNYTLCVRAYDYNTGMPLSEEEPMGCSNTFTIVNAEPPVINNPVCGDSILEQPGQNVFINWTPSTAISSGGIQYQLQVQEIPEGVQINPNELFDINGSYWYEETTFANIVMLTADKALLTPGFTYAFRVQAIDPQGSVSFRNQGISEVCWFTYYKELVFQDLIKIPDNSIADVGVEILENEFELIPTTSISGRLVCKSPNDVMAGASQATTPYSNTNYSPPINTESGANKFNYEQIATITQVIGGNVSQNSIQPSYSGSGFSMDALASLPPKVRNLIIDMKSKKYYFENTEPKSNTVPLANKQVILKARIAYVENENFGQPYPYYSFQDKDFQISSFYGWDLLGNYNETVWCKDVILDVATTDADGNYSFDFQTPFFTGPVIYTTMEFPEIDPGELLVEETVIDELGWNVFPGYDEGILTNVLNTHIVNEGLNPAHTGANSQVMHGTLPAGANSLPGVNAPSGATQFMSGNAPANMLVRPNAYICLKIEIEDPKFLSPDIDVFATPGDAVNIPEQVACIKTYMLQVNVKSDNSDHQLNGKNNPLAGVEVKIMRDENHINEEADEILDYEIKKCKTKTMTANRVFQDVAIAKTNENGNSLLVNLVKHHKIYPQYHINLSTRENQYDSTSYENTLYNYETRLEVLPTQEKSEAEGPVFPAVIYNHQYKVPDTVKLQYVMKPLPSEIKGRVMAASNIENIGLNKVNIVLTNQNSNAKFPNLDHFLNETSKERDTETDNVGFFSFPSLSMNIAGGNVVGPYRRLKIMHPSYLTEVIPPVDELPWNLGTGQLKDIKDVNLQPSQLMTGYVTDEKGKPVKAHIKTAYSPYYETKTTGNYPNYKESFELPVVQHGNQIKVHPLSSRYFTKDTIINILPNGSLKLVVYEKLHRPEILVKNKSGNPVPNAHVKIGDIVRLTNNEGIARLEFPSAGDQFILNINAPGDATGISPYAALQESVNIPVSRHPVRYEYVLSNAKSIKGRITDKQTGNPIPHARVFIELKNTDGFKFYIEVKSNTSGFYILNGIPTELSSIVVHAGKEGANPSYTGVVKTINFPLTTNNMITPEYNFELTKIDGWDLSEIWKFPMVVEFFSDGKTSLNGEPDAAIISGYFYNPPKISSFALQQPELKIPFTLLKVTRDSNGKTVPKNKNIIDLDIIDIPLQVNQSFTGTLSLLDIPSGGTASIISAMYGIWPKKPLKLAKEVYSNGVSGIQGMVTLDLESFKVSHDFNGDFYIGDENSNKAIVFASSDPIGIGHKHSVFSMGNNLQRIPLSGYTVFSFNAGSDLANAQLKDGLITLPTILHTKIPTCAGCQLLDLKIYAGIMNITNTNIQLVEESAGLNFNLEQWKVESKHWSFDKNIESIILSEAVIKTSQGIDVKMKNMKVRSDGLTGGDIDLNNAGLMLGGIAEIELSEQIDAIFNYDNLGHYRISLISKNNQPAGIVKNLPNMEGDLVFESIGLLSNNENALTIRDNFRFYELFDIYVDQIMTGDGSFKLNGMPTTHIPEFTGQSATVMYSIKNNKLASTLEPLKGFTSGRGNVNFIFDEEEEDQTIKTGEFTTYGNIEINPATGESGDIVRLRGFLTKTKDACNIKVIKVDGHSITAHEGSIPQKMRVGNNIFEIPEGSITSNLSAQKWNNLKYKGKPTTIVGLEDDSNIFDFEVSGAIDVNSSDIKVTNIDMGKLGKMNLVYDFEEKSLSGDLTMDNVDMGFAKVNGQLDVRFDNSGFYLVYSGGLNMGGQAFMGGFIVAAHSNVPQYLISDITANFNSKFTPKIGDLTGFYVIGVRKLIDFNLSLPISGGPIPDIGVSAEVGIGSYIFANFSKPVFKLGGYAYGKLIGGINIFEVCEFDLSTTVFAGIEGSYENGSIVLKTCGDADVGIGICGGSISAGVKMETIYTSSGFTGSIELGSCGN